MLKKIGENRYLIPKSYKSGMRIEGLIYANDELIGQIEKDQTIEQVANVATLPGLVGRSLAMPDAHQGYGFCIGGVAAADMETGVVSAGGVGFDINCGVRLLTTPFSEPQLRPKLEPLVHQIFRDVPSGAGRTGLVNLPKAELDKVLQQGARWAAENGYGFEDDLQHIEEYGTIPNADPGLVSHRAK
jgi:tRNA-splicing ligase RtcB